MPRSKPEKTLTYRIELGTKERQMVEDALETWQTARIVEVTTEGVKDLITPFLSITTAGAVVLASAISYVKIESAIGNQSTWEWYKEAFKDLYVPGYKSKKKAAGEPQSMTSMSDNILAALKDVFN